MSNLIDLLPRLRASLMDIDAQIWQESALKEALSQSLADVNRASGQAYGVSGLTDPVTLLLPGLLAPLLLRGAVSYALLARAAERLDAYNINSTLPAQLLDAAAAIGQRFDAGLAALAGIRVSELHTSADAPYSSSGGWDLPAAANFD